MKKKLKLLSSVFVVFSLLCVSTINVFAVTFNKLEAIPVSTSAILVREAVDVDDDILSVLSDNGAKINEKTVIEVLEINESDDTAICVTNVENNIVDKDVFISYVKNGDDLAVDNSIAELLAQGPDANMTATCPEGDFIIHATATSAIYLDGLFVYYKPYKCTFYYEKYNNVNVSYINVDYAADGFLFTYPGFEPTDEPEYVHVVSVSKSNPVVGNTYSNEKYFPSNRVLQTSSGSPFVGHSLTFYYVADGESQTYSVNI